MLEVECAVCSDTAVRRDAHAAGWIFAVGSGEVRNFCTKPECQAAGQAYQAEHPQAKDPQRLSDKPSEQIKRMFRKPD